MPPQKQYDVMMKALMFLTTGIFTMTGFILNFLWNLNNWKGGIDAKIIEYNKFVDNKNKKDQDQDNILSYHEAILNNSNKKNKNEED